MDINWNLIKKTLEKVVRFSTIPLDIKEGEVPEWSNGAVSKTVVRLRTQGSNPCLSATISGAIKAKVISKKGFGSTR